MKKKLLKTLGWILLVATIIVFYDNMSVMAAVVVVLVIMNYGLGIFLTIGKKILQFAFGKITNEVRTRIKKDPSAGSHSSLSLRAHPSESKTRRGRK